MSEYNFKLGARIKDSKGRVGYYGMVDGSPVCWVDGRSRPWYMCADDWELAEPETELESTRNMLPEPAHESDWSYAEAERLQKLAHDAIDVYNAYINAKPNTVFLTIFK